MEKIFELGKSLFKVEDYYVCVSDEVINSWTYYVGHGLNGLNIFKWHESQEKAYPTYINKKIIFSSKFIHESIPVLDIESEENTINESIKDSDSFVYNTGFIAGYQKAKEIFKYTEEDIASAYEAGINNVSSDGYILNEQEEDFKNLIRQLQQLKEIKSIEIDFINYNGTTSIDRDWNGKPVILPNGKVKCKVNYVQD